MSTKSRAVGTFVAGFIAGVMVVAVPAVVAALVHCAGAGCEWGNIATWVQSGTTLAALAAAAIVVGVELQREQRTEDIAVRAQADLVAAWSEYYYEDVGKLREGWAAVVKNSSTLPIYDVEVEFVFTWPSWAGSPDSREFKRKVEGAGVVPPKTGRRLYWPEPPEPSIPLMVPTPQASGSDGETTGALSPQDRKKRNTLAKEARIAVRFRDATGRQWHRSEHGKLM